MACTFTANAQALFGINVECKSENKIHMSTPGPGCSKLTTSLVNETLKFQMLISQICYFLLKKM